jgi:hypothetical protein
MMLLPQEAHRSPSQTLRRIGVLDGSGHRSRQRNLEIGVMLISYSIQCNGGCLESIRLGPFGKPICDVVGGINWSGTLVPASNIFAENQLS